MSLEEAIEYAESGIPNAEYVRSRQSSPTSQVAGIPHSEFQIPHSVDELHIEVNQAKKARQVEAIIETEYFKELQRRANALLLERKEREASTHRRQ